MTLITIDQAASAVGCVRQTIANRLNAGLLTKHAAINERGRAYIAIDKGELLETFSSLKTGRKKGYKVVKK